MLSGLFTQSKNLLGTVVDKMLNTVGYIPLLSYDYIFVINFNSSCGACSEVKGYGNVE